MYVLMWSSAGLDRKCMCSRGAAQAWIESEAYKPLVAFVAFVAFAAFVAFVAFAAFVAFVTLWFCMLLYSMLYSTVVRFGDARQTGFSQNKFT